MGRIMFNTNVNLLQDKCFCLLTNMKIFFLNKSNMCVNRGGLDRLCWREEAVKEEAS